MKYQDKLDLAQEMATALYKRAFDDETILLKHLDDTPGSLDVATAELAESIRGRFVSLVWDRLNLSTSDNNIAKMADVLEHKSVKTIRELVDSYFGNTPSMSELLRPGRNI